jgi:site-specific DNA-cytosine methylase
MLNPSREIRHFHLFCGIGGGAIGFNSASARVGNLSARFRCLGGIDSDPAVISDFSRHVGVSGTAMNLFDADQFRDFHGCEPPSGWREATPDDIRRAAGYERPHIVFTSAPCKGFSGLLSQKKSTTAKYQALNRLTLRGVWLTLEAWQDDPPEFILFENVPRIATRGRELLDQITQLLRLYGYAVAETTHDCGELAGLSQSRKRFLLVARHAEKVPPFLYEPVKRQLGSVGSVLEKLPLPGMGGNPMHELPRLQWKTWVRLAFVKAGSDWRSLKDLVVEDGMLRDFGIVPDRPWQDGSLGVLDWAKPTGVITAKASPQSGRFSIADPREFGRRNDYLGVLGFGETAGTVTGNSRALSGRFNVADPRTPGESDYAQYGVRSWESTMGAITGQTAPGGGPNSIADPRLPDSKTRQYNFYRIVEWSKHANTITGAAHVSGGAPCVADPRGPEQGTFGKYAVTRFDDQSGTVIAGSTTGQRAFAVADPRPGLDRGKGDHYLTGGHYGVVAYDEPCGAVSAAACHDNGRWSVADPELPQPSDNVACVIRALDGTWHRPFTTYELAALQGFIDPDADFVLGGDSHQSWRERIGNAVPPPAAQAIGGVMGQTLLLAWSGETFAMSAAPIWVQPFIAGMMAGEVAP